MQRETDACTLYELARELSAALTDAQIVGIGSRFLRAAFDARAAFFLVGADGRLLPAATDPEAGGAAQSDAVDHVLAQWVTGARFVVTLPRGNPPVLEPEAAGLPA